jgi:hypothetical protein
MQFRNIDETKIRRRKRDGTFWRRPVVVIVADGTFNRGLRIHG